MPARLACPIGARFGKLTVIADAGTDHDTFWQCRCECGTITKAMATDVVRGHTKSCGCQKRERSAERMRTMRREQPTPTRHGHAREGLKTATYRTWIAMKQRCHDPNSKKYSDYGARGISVTKPWRDSFESFLNDMGERPLGLTIDRIDNRFGYFMSNCRWATAQQQAQNRRPRRKHV